MKQFLLLVLMLAVPAFASPTALTVQVASETAASLNEQSCDSVNGNYVPNTNGDVALVLYNSDNSNSATVTVTAQKTTFTNVKGYGPLTKSSLAVSLATGARKIVGPFPAGAWNDSNGRVQLTFSGSGASSVKVAPIRVPR